MENSRKPKSQYIKTMEEYVKLVYDPAININRFHVVNEDVILKTISSQKFLDEVSFQNEIIGCFITSHARLVL